MSKSFLLYGFASVIIICFMLLSAYFIAGPAHITFTGKVLITIIPAISFVLGFICNAAIAKAFNKMSWL